MSQPAARITDMHVCPMQTPATPPVPHVGGPILPPGEPRALIGGLPAARVGDLCTCVGPPDTIVKGSPTVMIGGRPRGCPRCGAALRAWARFCGKCGADVSSAAAVPADPAGRAELLEQVREAAGEVYRVLGEMPWAGGGGLVYFALEKESGRLVRLRLQASTEGMALGETRMAVPLERLAADYVSEVSLPPVPPPAPGATTPTNPGRSRTALLVGGAVAVIVLLIVLALLR